MDPKPGKQRKPRHRKTKRQSDGPASPEPSAPDPSRASHTPPRTGAIAFDLSPGFAEPASAEAELVLESLRARVTGTSGRRRPGTR